MELQHYKPIPELSDLVSRIMYVKYTLDPGNPRPVNPFPPQPEHTLYFYLGDSLRCRNYATGIESELPPSIVVGPQLNRVDLTMGINVFVVIVFFKVGGLFRLVGVPMREMMDNSFDSSLLLGKEIKDLTEQLMNTENYNQRIMMIQQFLVSKIKTLKAGLPMEQVMTNAFVKNELTDIDRLAAQACISTRQFERQCYERIGMAPKTFARVARFSKAWFMREMNPQISWLSIAHACDYADQMHMIRDFKEFAGVTPGSLQNDLLKSPLRLQADSTRLD